MHSPDRGRDDSGRDNVGGKALESRLLAGERSGAQTARARMERGGGIERAGVGGEGGQASSRGTPARSWIDGICKYL